MITTRSSPTYHVKHSLHGTTRTTGTLCPRSLGSFYIVSNYIRGHRSGVISKLGKRQKEDQKKKNTNIHSEYISKQSESLQYITIL